MNTVQQFPTIHKVEDLSNHRKIFFVEFRNTKIPVYYQDGSSDTLVIYFHGAINRDMGPPPKMQGIDQRNTLFHHLSISDPGLLETDLSVCWYQGSGKTDYFQILLQFIADVKVHLGVKRTVYVGASSGGFAALAYPRKDPGSVCIAANPQTNLYHFYGQMVEDYHRECWAQDYDLETFLALDRFNLDKQYAQTFDNTVVYLQNTTDRLHLYNHFVPFAAAMKANRHFVPWVGFWGVLDHPDSVPFVSTISLWLRALSLIEGIDSNELLLAFHDVSKTMTTSSNAAVQESIAPDPEMLRLNRMLKEWTAREGV